MITDYGEVIIIQCFNTGTISILDSNKKEIVKLTHEDIYENWADDFTDALRQHRKNIKNYMENQVIFKICGEPFLELAYKIRESRNKPKLLEKIGD